MHVTAAIVVDDQEEMVVMMLCLGGVTFCSVAD